MAKAKAAEVDEGVSFGEGTEGESLVVDLNDVEDSSFEPMPKGMYECVIDSLDFVYSQNSGNPMWTWVLEVQDGEFAGRKLFFHTVFKGAGLPITKKAISRVAPELLEAPFDPQEVADSGTMIGKPLRARVDVRKYEGEMRNNVKELFAASEGGDSF